MMLKIVLLLILVPACLACTCMDPTNPNGAFEDAYSVFKGVVIDREVEDWMNIYFSFNVSRVWKGPSRPMLTVKTTDANLLCGYPFELGKEYIVVANGIFLETGACSGTVLLDDRLQYRTFTEEMIDFGPGKAPREPNLTLALFVLALCAAVLFYFARKRS